MPDAASAAPVAGTGVPEPAEQVTSTELPVHAQQADHHRLQDPESGELRGQDVGAQHSSRTGE